MHLMKYVVVLGDGMADYRIAQLGNKSPLESAKKPFIDYLAGYSEIGMVKTIPDGIPPGSDVANLSVMGYNPKKYYTGRSPLEAVSMGIDLSETDLAFRCNLVTLDIDGSYESASMLDYSSDEISTGEAAKLINDINKYLSNETLSFYRGISYRHCMVWKNGAGSRTLTPPHDILGKSIAPYIPKGDNSEMFLTLQKKSSEILRSHPVNLARIDKGLRPANSIWLWGEGRRPAIPKFIDKYGITGSVVSAVDLVKGIGICAGLDTIDAEGATGNIHTNFKGKAEAALKELQNGKDFVYIHIEAPDECGHRFETENKVKSIKYIDELVVGTLLEGLKAYDDYSILILPDHPTPLSLRTHTSEPVPYLLYRKSGSKPSSVKGYDEFQARETGIYIEDGYTLMDRFLGK